MKKDENYFDALYVFLLIFSLIGLIVVLTTSCTDKAEAVPITGPVCVECTRNNPGGPPLPDATYDTCFQDVQQANSYVLEVKMNYTECKLKTR